MALENYTGKIADLVVTNPTPTDPKSQGDDHLRGIKFTLQQSFPGFDGPLDASKVPFTPTPGISATNVQSAVAGLSGFMRNKLINGEVTRINQRGVANWAAVANGAYGYDRWKKIDASSMTQIIEAGNFRPNTVHTLSGIGVTTQQITSPASGNWTLPNITIAATNVQVEEGLEATPFEVRHIGFEVGLCQRYYEIGTVRADYWPVVNSQVFRIWVSFATAKRISNPTMTKLNDLVAINVYSLSATLGTVAHSGFTATIHGNTAGVDVQGAFTWGADAEL